MVSELEIAVWQRIFAKFPTQTNREIILRIREFLECTRGGEQGLGKR
jgi:hypothetical protein